MILTFAQYSILSATHRSVTYGQLKQQTNFDLLMINYYIRGLLTAGLIKASDNEGNENTCYQLTTTGSRYVDEYERANPALIIKQTMS